MRNFFSEAKVSDFPVATFLEDISWLQIPMNYIFASQILASLTQLIGDSSPLWIPVLSEVVLKISSFTVLHDDIAMIGRMQDFD